MYKLSMSQREVLAALVELYERNKRMIKSKEVADLIKKDEGTVRNIIASLRSMGLVESKTGPSGGYIPTLKAFELLRRPTLPSYGYIRVYKDGRELDVAVIGLELIDLLSPEGSRAVIRVTGNISQINVGDTLRMGPTPYTRVLIEGEVTHVDFMSGQISLAIKKLAAVPKEYVGSIASKNLIVLDASMTLREAARVLYRNRIRGAPVVEKGKVVGIITTTDLARAIAEGKTEGLVRDYMRKNVVAIREDEDILDAIKLMDLHDIGRLLVTDAVGRPVGVITRTDILKRISGLM